MTAAPSRRERAAVVLLAAAAGLTSIFLSVRVLEGIPHVSDGISYAFQGRIFASGRLWLAPPPLPELFQQQNVLLTATRWCSIYPPGWPLLLALGWLIRAPGLVDPILTGVAVVGVWRLGRALFDSRTGLLGAACLAASPFALLMGAGFLSHTAALCAAVWCLALLAEGTETGAPGRRLVLAGLLGGLAFLIRPYTAVSLLAPAVLWALWRRRGERAWIRALGAMALGGSPMLFLFFLYNALVFGSPLRTGYGLLYPGFSFGGLSGGEISPVEVIGRFGHCIRDLCNSIWGLPFPDLLLLLPLLWPRALWRRDLMLGLCALSLVAAHSLYFYHDLCYSGPRFAFEAVGPLALLAARSLLALRDWGGALLGERRQFAWALTVIIVAFLALFPLRRLVLQARYHAQAYHGQTAEPLRLASAAEVGENALIFVGGRWFSYGSFFLHNALDPRDGGRVFVRALERGEEAALETFPRQEVWVVTVHLDELPGPNDYADAWRFRGADWRRLR